MLQQYTSVSSFTVNDRHAFDLVPTAGMEKAWVCAANNVRISERRHGGMLWEYVASRPKPNGGGTQWLSRHGHIRRFVSPFVAAKVALIEWS